MICSKIFSAVGSNCVSSFSLQLVGWLVLIVSPMLRTPSLEPLYHGGTSSVVRRGFEYAVPCFLPALLDSCWVEGYIGVLRALLFVGVLRIIVSGSTTSTVCCVCVLFWCPYPIVQMFFIFV